MKIPINPDNEDSGVSGYLEVQELGRGQFSRCYRIADPTYRDQWGNERKFCPEGSVISFVKEDYPDYSKEAISLWAEGKHIPEFKRDNAVMFKGDWCHVFISPYYLPLTASNKVAWKQYRLLEKTWNEVRWHLNWNYGDEKEILIGIVEIFIPALRESGIDKEIVDNLETIANTLYSFSGNWSIEFVKRNLKVDAKGNLILLDVFFPTVKRKIKNG